MADQYRPSSSSSPNLHAESREGEPIALGQALAPLRRHWTVWLGSIVLSGIVGAAGSFLITPQFTSKTTFIPPQQQQGSAASALASIAGLGNLSSLGGTKSPADQYISLMQSVSVSDRIVDRFRLMDEYKVKLRTDARDELANHVQMALGKKDNLITVAVEDPDPRKAAAIANQYVEELRQTTSVLAVTEAQQRRVFFEKQMQDSKAKLIAAQTALQQSGFTAGVIKTEPQAAAEQYAQLRAQATAADIRLQTLHSTLSESAPEVIQQTTLLRALHSKLEQLEASTLPDGSAPDYVSKYREFKYQETLFELMSKQYELARVDESHEGALIQVVDPAQPAEVKSRPRRSLIALGCAFVAGVLVGLTLIVRGRRPATTPH